MSKTVRLSNLKFAERWTNNPILRPGGELRFAEQESAEPKFIDGLPLSSQTTETSTYSLPHKFKHGESFKDKLSKDAPGSELAHDATIWKFYLEEAEEYDQELVEGRHSSLDVLLLFAALFSAILTTFLVESKNMLQQDPADTAAALLFIIAQNQAANSSSSQPVDIPSFKPTISALWINGLWFAALALSLAAALVAMLSKEWLTAYTASRPRPAHSHALLRQARFDGLNSWWALHIIALLPTLLHLALLLFALGLVVYLWTLEIVVAAVTGTIVALTLLFYLATTVLGAVFPYCPFVTEISTYVRYMTRDWLRKTQKPHATQQDSTSLDDMRAVSWLAENARDPIVIDCAYQALAGVRFPKGGEGEKWFGVLERVFPTLLARLGNILREGSDLAASRGANAARYCRALTGLAAFLGSGGAERGDQGESRVKRHSESPDPVLSDDPASSTVRPHAGLALEVLDGVWRDDHPPFSADTFACLTGSELRLTMLAAESIDLSSPVGANRTPTPTPSPPGSPRLGLLDDIELGTTSAQSTSNDSKLASLRMNYSRSLVRASVQLRYHIDGRTPIDGFALSYLLNSLRASASSTKLNPELLATKPDHSGLLSPSHPPRRTATTLDSQPNFIVPVFSFEHYLRPTDLARGPLGTVVRVLGTTSLKARASETHQKSSWQVRLACARALAALAPVILKRWMTVKVSKSDPNALSDEFSVRILDEWPDVDPNQDVSRLEGNIARQLMLVVRALGPHLQRAGAVNLIESVLAELNRIVVNTPYSAYLALRTDGSRDLAPLLEFADSGPVEGHVTLSATARAHIANILTFEVGGKQNPRRTYLPAQSIPRLLRLVRDASNDETIARVALKYVVDAARDTRSNIDYIRQFTHADQGFSSLVAIGLIHEEYTETVVNSILQITHIAVASGPHVHENPVLLSATAISGFLDAVSLVARHTVKMTDRQHHRHLHTFGRNMITLLQRIEPGGSAQIVLEHGALDEVVSGLETQSARSNSTASGSGSGSGRGQVQNTEYLVAQLRALKERLSELVSTDPVRGDGEGTAGRAV